MRIVIAYAIPAFAAFAGLMPPPPYELAWSGQSVMLGRMIAPVDDDSTAASLAADQTKATANGHSATSDRARMASGPSERSEPASPEVRQSPAGGRTKSTSGEAGKIKRRD